MFFSNSIANKKGFLHRPALFRGWTGAGGTPGAHHDAGLPNITGTYGAIYARPTIATGVFSGIGVIENNVLGGSDAAMDYLVNIVFEARGSNTIYGGSTTVMPPSVDIPVCLYMGQRA